MLRRGALQLGRRQIGLGHQSASAVSNHLIHQSKPATASNVFRAWFSSYPHHEVVGLPALSPVRDPCRFVFVYQTFCLSLFFCGFFSEQECLSPFIIE